MHRYDKPIPPPPLTYNPTSSGYNQYQAGYQYQSRYQYQSPTVVPSHSLNVNVNVMAPATVNTNLFSHNTHHTTTSSSPNSSGSPQPTPVIPLKKRGRRRWGKKKVWFFGISMILPRSLGSFCAFRLPYIHVHMMVVTRHTQNQVIWRPTYELIQAKNRTSARGKDVVGSLLALMNWRDITANIQEIDLSNAVYAKGPFLDLIIWHYTWKDMLQDDVRLSQFPLNL